MRQHEFDSRLRSQYSEPAALSQLKEEPKMSKFAEALEALVKRAKEDDSITRWSLDVHPGINLDYVDVTVMINREAAYRTDMPFGAKSMEGALGAVGEELLTNYFNKKGEGKIVGDFTGKDGKNYRVIEVPVD